MGRHGGRSAGCREGGLHGDIVAEVPHRLPHCLTAWQPRKLAASRRQRSSQGRRPFIIDSVPAVVPCKRTRLVIMTWIWDADDARAATRGRDVRIPPRGPARTAFLCDTGVDTVKPRFSRTAWERCGPSNWGWRGLPGRHILRARSGSDPSLAEDTRTTRQRREAQRGDDSCRRHR